jgi:hypothetical protein
MRPLYQIWHSLRPYFFCPVNKPSLDPVSWLFILLIGVGVPINFLSNRFYDNGWTVGEWLISYSAGFVRRGLPGSALHGIASLWELQPIYLIWSASLLAYALLAGILWKLCRDKIDTVILLSPMVLLAPIIGNFLVRKDVLVLALYGMSLLVFGAWQNKKFPSLPCAFLVNVISIIAILSHESYGFWGLPSLTIIFSIAFLRSGGLFNESLVRSMLYLSPSFIAFLFCVVFKGSAAHALLIHQSWQSIANLLPSNGALSADSPTGAIDAIGWTTRQGLRLSYSTLNDFSFAVWVPAAWMLTIYICINLFVGSGEKHAAAAKRMIILFQFLTVTPLFILGWDFGRWIFLWIGSSAILYGFATSFAEEQLGAWSGGKAGFLAQKIAPGLELKGSSKIAFLFLGIPGCCWSVKGFLASTPILYAFSNLRFLLGMIRKVLLELPGLLA